MEEEREKYTSLNREDRYLEREKKRAEYETESRKKKQTKQEGELERELEVCRNKCNELSVELEEKKMECVGFAAKLEELAQYKMMYNGIKQQMTCLEENRRVVCQSENKAQEWISYLSKEMKKMERDDREKFAKLEVKMRDLESGIRRVEGENEGLKTKFTELGIEFSRHKHEVQVEKVGLQVQYNMMYNVLKQQMTCLEEDRRVVCQSENKAQLCIAYMSEEMKKMERYYREKSAELEIKVRDLESGQRRVEDENESLKKRFTESGIEFSMHKHKVQVERNDRQKNAELEIKEHDKSGIYVLLKNDNREQEEFRRKIEETEIWKKKCNAYKITCKRLKEQLSEREKVAQGRITNLSEKLINMESDEREIYDQLEEANQDLESTKTRAEAEIDDWKNGFKDFETQAAMRGKLEGELEKQLDVYRTSCDALPKELKKIERDEKESRVSGVIESERRGLQTEVSHNDEKDDRNKTIKLQSEAYGADINGALVAHIAGTPSIDMQNLPVIKVEEDLELEGTNEMQDVLELGSIRPASGRIIDISDDSSDNSSVKEKDLAPKICLKRLYSDQRGKIYRSKCNEDTPFTSSPKRKRASETPNVSCGGLNVEEKNGWAQRTSPNEHTFLTQLDMSRKSNEKVSNQTAEKGKEKMKEEVGSDYENGSLGGFNLEGWIFNRDNQSNLKVGNYISTSIREKKNLDIVIDGSIMGFFQVPSPVCSCTGVPRQCYRWGADGWQSICCTTNLSEYPLPMSSLRPGARLAGRKMSNGAYGKLLQRLAAEGYDFTHAVDLKDHWAKHGTNQFVTIK